MGKHADQLVSVSGDARYAPITHAKNFGRASSHAARRSADIQRKLFDAAKQLFAERGYSEIGTRDIVSLAGVGLGTFYLYFEDKFDCFFAVTKEAADEVADLIRRYSLPATDFHSMISAIVRAALDYSSANPGIYRALTARHKILSAKTTRPTMRWADFYAVQIEGWKRLGYISDKWDSKLLAYLIVGVVAQGGTIVSLNPSSKNIVLQNLVQFLMRALQACPAEGSRWEKYAESIAETEIEKPAAASRNISRKRFATRQRILTTARRLFSCRDYHDVGCEEIAQEAGVGIGTFYIYFKDKLDCFLAFVNEGMDEMHDFAIQNLSLASDPSEEVYVWMYGNFHYSAVNPGVVRCALTDTKILSREKKRPVPRGMKQASALLQEWKNSNTISSAYDTKVLVGLIASVLTQADVLIARRPEQGREITDGAVHFIAQAMHP